MVRYNQSQSTSLSAMDETLFTEISPEQAAVVEGGLQVLLTSIRCIKAGADLGSGDDVFVRYNSRDANALNGPDLTFAKPKSMTTGSFSNISTKGSASGSVRVDLFDKDSTGPQLLGGFRVSSAGRRTRTVSGSGSTYEISFTAF